MTGITPLLIDLFLVFLAAKLAAELFERIHQPPVIGELLAGVLIGPYALGLIGTPDLGLVEAFHGDAVAAQEAVDLVYHLIAELGIVVLLFFVGLETRFADILRVGRRAGVVAVLGVIIPFALGYGLMGPLLGHPSVEAIFVGAALVATSVGITARVLRDLGVIASMESRIILGAAVIDDILAMIILAVVAGLGDDRVRQPRRDRRHRGAGAPLHRFHCPGRHLGGAPLRPRFGPPQDGRGTAGRELAGDARTRRALGQHRPGRHHRRIPGRHGLRRGARALRAGASDAADLPVPGPVLLRPDGCPGRLAAVPGWRHHGHRPGRDGPGAPRARLSAAVWAGSGSVSGARPSSASAWHRAARSD